MTGNLIRGQNASGVWQRFEYDAAGRLVKVKDDSNNVIETYTYGASRERLMVESSAQRRYFAGGGNPLVEYTEATASSTPVYSKSYVYAGSRLLSTATNNSGTEVVEFHHPDRLGTKLVTNASAGTNYQQSTLPFGTALDAESSGYSNQVFTSYDRGASAGLDYAVNRTYSSGQSRFTQVDPIGMAATSGDAQSMNLYSYVQNQPVDFVDPSGLLTCLPGYYAKAWGIGCVTHYDEDGTPHTECSTYQECVKLDGIGEPFRIINEPSSGGGGGGGNTPVSQPPPKNPGSPTKSCAGQLGEQMSSCMARCLNNNRVDKAAKALGDATGIEGAGELMESLTWASTGAAILNEALNMTSLGRKPRGGLTGKYKAGDPTTWQHTVSGEVGRELKKPVIGRIGRAVGRASKVASVGILAFEIGYTAGTNIGCQAECASKLKCR